MSNSFAGIAQQYAKSIMKVTGNSDLLQTVIHDLNLVMKSLVNFSNLQNILYSRWVSKKEKLLLWNNISHVFNINSISLSCIIMMIKNHRLNILRNIIKELEKIFSQKNNKILIEVKSAVEINQEMQNNIINLLEKILNQQPIAQFIIDQTILGGIIVYSDDKILDLSMKNKIYNLKQLFHIQ